MKIRSGLLVACMIVVPLLAMFSHHIPRSAARAAGELTWDLVEAQVSSIVGKAPAEEDSPRVAAPPELAAGQKPAAPEAAAWKAANGAAAAPTDSRDLHPRVAHAPAHAPATRRQAGASDGHIPPQTSPPPAADRGGVAGRLVDLGATDIECHSEPGAGGRHRATCRIPVDAAGQLHRVFQATGPDRSTAERNLLTEVMARKHRMAAAPSGAGASAAVPPQRPGTAF